MMLRKDRLKRSTCLFYMALLWVIAQSNPLWACEGVIADPLEKIYCDVKAKGGGQSLPRFDDFRRNNPKMQRLLLKRPAEKAGLSLPNVSKSNGKQPSAGASHVRGDKRGSDKRGGQERDKKQPLSPSSGVAHPVPSRQLSGCKIVSRGIHCGERRYKLRDNIANRSLEPSALGATNTLILPEVPAYSGSRALHQYLYNAYAVYLQKMDAIGLAGATFTYSKFYYIFEDAQVQKQDFVQRFKNMYHYLKKDKATMAAAKRHKGNTLSSLATCERYGDQYISCDIRGVNWLFRAER